VHFLGGSETCSVTIKAPTWAAANQETPLGCSRGEGHLQCKIPKPPNHIPVGQGERLRSAPGFGGTGRQASEWQGGQHWGPQQHGLAGTNTQPLARTLYMSMHVVSSATCRLLLAVDCVLITAPSACRSLLHGLVRSHVACSASSHSLIAVLYCSGRLC